LDNVSNNYAALTGATFTGPVSGPTQATTDSSAKLATTAYVKNNLANIMDLTSAQTITGLKTFTKGLYLGYADQYGSLKILPNTTSDSDASMSFFRYFDRRLINPGDLWYIGQNVAGAGYGNFAIGNNSTAALTILSNGNMTAPGSLTLGSSIMATGANFTGTATGPTPATSDNSTKLATTAFVQNVVIGHDSFLVSTLSNNPNFTGTAKISAPPADAIRITPQTSDDENRITFYKNSDQSVSASAGDAWYVGRGVKGARSQKFSIVDNNNNNGLVLDTVLGASTLTSNLTMTGDLTVNGKISSGGGMTSLTMTGDLTVNGKISSGGGMTSLTVTGDLTVNGKINGGNSIASSKISYCPPPQLANQYVRLVTLNLPQNGYHAWIRCHLCAGYGITANNLFNQTTYYTQNYTLDINIYSSGGALGGTRAYHPGSFSGSGMPGCYYNGFAMCMTPLNQPLGVYLVPTGTALGGYVEVWVQVPGYTGNPLIVVSQSGGDYTINPTAQSSLPNTGYVKVDTYMVFASQIAL
jgi:hypothetical protein